jgi:hypothetical protein
MMNDGSGDWIMGTLEKEIKECPHNWIEICAVYHHRLNAEGFAVRCTRCNALGFRKTDFRKIENDTMMISGMDVSQAEYRSDGRPFHVWDAHL